MIEEYSKTKLTMASVKLPALAGLAKAFGREDDLYIAGTWMQNWRDWLCWQASSSRSLKKPAGLKYNRAPSWSWARLDGKVVFCNLTKSQDEQESTVNAKLLSISHMISDYLGQVSDITLEIEGCTEWVLVRSTTRNIEPPSSYNDWIGTYDQVNGNWGYRSHEECQKKYCDYLRLLIQCSGHTVRNTCFLLTPAARRPKTSPGGNALSSDAQIHGWLISQNSQKGKTKGPDYLKAD